MSVNINRRTFLTGTAAAAASFALAACGGSNTSSSAAGSSAGSASEAGSSAQASYKLVTPGKLTIAAELGFAPFEYIDEGSTDPVGFDVDLIKAVAQKMGLEAEYLPNQAFDTLVPLIKQGGKADVAIAGITITDDRKEEVDFTDPYLDSNQGLIVKADSAETQESLNDASKKVACQAGTTGEEWIKENIPDCTVVPLADVTASLEGVTTGLYDAFVIDLPVASNMISQSFKDLKVALEIPTGEQYGIIVSKDNPELTKALNEALAAVKEDGTQDEIETKWFGSVISQ
jgi:polar amino acid transport system substrate-binding protein